MNWYGHRYLGPGNKLSNGEPVDEDDRIARIHDNLYNIATKDEDIREADRDAIKHFLNLNSAHGYLGAAGLAAKYGVESLTGVLYPNMKRTPSEAQLAARKRYAKVQKQLADTSKKLGIPFREIQQAHSKDAWNDLTPPEQEEPKAGPSREHHTEEESQIEETPDSSLPEFQDSDHLGLFEDLNNMEIDAPSINGTNNNQVLAGTGPSGASGRSSGSHVVGHIVRIPRPLAPKPITVTFRKSRIFFSYGICTKRINLNQDDYFTSPLALIPVDFTGFYLSPAEFQELGDNAFAKECRVKVTPLGIRTAFEYGGSTSGHTTNEFVPIGMVGVGLNVNCEVCNVTYAGIDNMKPSGIKDIQPQDILQRYYNEDDCHVNMVSRHAVGYATFVEPSLTQAKDTFYNYFGKMRQDQFVDQFLINTAIGKPIVDYKYTFKHAPISTPYVNPANVQSQYVYRGGPNARMLTVSAINNSDGKTAKIGTGVTTTMKDNTENYTLCPLNRNIVQFLEKTGYNLRTGGWTYSAQPQIHIGIQAVPAMSPGLDTTNFQNTSAYWAVEAELDVEIKHGSYYASGNTVMFPKDLSVWNFTTYHGQPTLAGIVAEGNRPEPTPPPKPPLQSQQPKAPTKKMKLTPTTPTTVSDDNIKDIKVVRKNLSETFSKLDNENKGE